MNVGSRRPFSVFDRAEAVRCPDCALAGIASFTNEQASEAKIRLPKGFKVVATDAGNQIYCLACNRPAITLPIEILVRAAQAEKFSQSPRTG
jgi:hypothetical protein